MTLKAKIKFKESTTEGNDDVIVIKVKRKHWEDFSQLLGAAREGAESYHVSTTEAAVIEQKFDNIVIENT